MSLDAIVVTGASGFIGSWVAAAVAQAAPQRRVIGVGRRTDAPPVCQSPNYEYVSCNLLDVGAVRRHLPDRLDAVVHLAGDGRTMPPPEEYHAQLEANVVLTSAMIEYAIAAKARRFIQASSVYVYSGSRRLPFAEPDVGLPVEHLGATKLAGEALLHARASAGGVQAVALRLFTVYGPGGREWQFIPQAIRKLQSDEPVASFRSPDVARDFVYIADVAEAFLAALRLTTASAYAAFNVGSGTATPIREVVRLLAELLGVRKRVEFLDVDRAPSPAGTANHQADLAATQAVLRWRPATPLAAGLRRTIEQMSAVSP